VSTTPATPRERIIAAAFALVLKGGTEAVQMREVAARAHVSTRTLHIYFPSKNYLLLAAFVAQGDAAGSALDAYKLTARDPVRRVVASVTPITDSLVALPHVARALLVALMTPDPRAVPLLSEYRDRMVARTLEAINPRNPTDHDREIALTLAQVWFGAFVGWATGIEEPDYILNSVRSAATHLLRPRQPRRPSGGLHEA
jgi:AcrR family transcriptional regulator